MFCPNCGAECEDSAKFCMDCGCPLETVPVYCPNCGCKLEEDAVFCPECEIQQKIRKIYSLRSGRNHSRIRVNSGTCSRIPDSNGNRKNGHNSRQIRKRRKR